ncbi:MAG TPA: cytochrome c oxidase assembly protein [Gammaproteobacteria bacterium]|nr:cytochrome c oxidase assembly protein [Gammaproteobacteria bacterium]
MSDHTLKLNVDKALDKKNKKLLLILCGGVLLMFGFCYMLVPLYELVCKKEGINGKSVNSAAAYGPGIKIDTSRTIKVYFTTTLHSGLKFKFIPLQRSIDIHPGERKLIYFYAENQSGGDMTVQAIPSITPMDGARFLKKTECFCFTQQYFFKGEKADMPVYFFIEPEVSKNIKEITLSYTLFDVAGYVKTEQHFTKGRIDL